MSKQKGGGSGSRVFPVLATAIAMYLARRAVTMAWTRTTGKVPPTDPADTSVSLLEALSWAAIAGITVEAARLFATRATIRHQPVGAGDTEPS
jgi:hypothetical protein